MLKPKIFLLVLMLALAGCSNIYEVSPTERVLIATTGEHDIVLVNDLDVPVTLLRRSGEGRAETLATGAGSAPLHFTLEKWRIRREGAEDEILLKTVSPLLEQQTRDIVVFIKAGDAPRREAHLGVGDCLFESTAQLHHTIPVSRFPWSGARVLLCP